MSEKFYYPAVFSAACDGITVTFPDFNFIVTQGLNWHEAVEKAKEVLGIGIDDYLQRGEMPPKASDILKLKPEKNSSISLISVDMDEWAKTNSSAN